MGYRLRLPIALLSSLMALSLGLFAVRAADCPDFPFTVGTMLYSRDSQTIVINRQGYVEAWSIAGHHYARLYSLDSISDGNVRFTPDGSNVISLTTGQRWDAQTGQVRWQQPTGGDFVLPRTAPACY